MALGSLLTFRDRLKRKISLMQNKIAMIMMMLNIKLIMTTLTILPVSYTHLDVYKRQTLSATKK